MEVNERIFVLLKEHRKTAKDLCDFIGINPASVSAWKTEGSYPSSKYIVGISEFLKVTPNFLLTGKKDSTLDQDTQLEGKSVWKLSDYQKIAVEESLDCLTEEQATLINNYEKLDHRDKTEIRLLIEHKLKTYDMGLSSNSRTSKDGNSGSRTA